MKPSSYWLLLLLVVTHAAHATNNRERLEQALSEPGKHHLPLTVGAVDAQTIMPVTVVKGHHAGPTLVVLAGVHGAEYGPIVATQRLAMGLDAEQIHGAVIFVHVANLPAFLNRTVYQNPIDGKNLNRTFPGAANGTQTERIAFTLTRDVFPLADAVLDMHSGDANEDLRPAWTGYYGKAGGADIIAKSRAMAFAFGLTHIVEFQWELTDASQAIWGGSAAIAMGIPAIDVEAGGRGLLDESAIRSIQEGVARVMSHLDIVPSSHPPPATPSLIRTRRSIKAPEDGSWTPLIEAGQPVKQDQLVGYLSDWYGRRIFEARAPIDGLLMVCFSAPPARQGDTLAVIGQVEDPEPGGRTSNQPDD